MSSVYWLDLLDGNLTWFSFIGEKSLLAGLRSLGGMLMKTLGRMEPLRRTGG